MERLPVVQEATALSLQERFYEDEPSNNVRTLARVLIEENTVLAEFVAELARELGDGDENVASAAITMGTTVYMLLSEQLRRDNEARDMDAWL